MEKEIMYNPDVEVSSEQPISLGLKLFTIFMGILVILACFLVIDMIAYDNAYLNYIRYGKQTNYKVDPRFKIVSNGKYYAIMVNERGSLDSGYFLYSGKYGIEPYPKNIAFDRFLDSNNAKSYLKVYVDRMRAKSLQGKDFR